MNILPDIKQLKATNVAEPKAHGPVRPRESGPKSQSDDFATHLADSPKSSPTVKEKTKTQLRDLSTDSSAALAGVATPQLIAQPLEAKNSTPAEPESSGGIVKNIPILAFLTGKLDRLEPASIPQLVTENQFVNQAMTTDDLSTFMNTPQPVHELLSQLGASLEVKTMMSQGLAPDATITPKQMLQTLGVDAGVVSSELEMLKSNLSLEGLEGYVNRAEALQQKRTALTDLQKPSSAPSSSLPLSQIDHASRPTVAPMQKPVAMQKSASMQKPMDHSMATSMPLAPTTPLPVQGGLEQTSKASVDLSQADVSMVALETSSQAQNLTVPTELSMKEVPARERLSLAHDSAIISSDPRDIQRFDESFALAKVEAVKMDPLVTAKPTPVMLMTEQMQQMNKTVDEEVLLSEPEIMSYQRLTAEGALTPNKPELFDATQLSIERLLADAQTLSQDVEVKSDLSGFEQDHEPSVVPELSITEPNQDPLAYAVGVDSPLKFDLEDPSKTKISESKAVDQIVNKATEETQKVNSLNKSGSVVLDLGTPETGKIDVKVDYKNDQVGIKILAASDHVKEQLSSDLFRLRDAFAAQNIDLRQVDVALHKNAFKDSDASGFQQNQNSQKNWLDTEAPQPWMQKSSLTQQSINRAFNRMHSGRIQVLA